MFESIEAALARGDGAAALTAAEEVVAQHPQDARALHLLGIAQRLCGDPQAAAASFDRAIALSPDAAKIHFSRAVLALSGDDSEAGAAALDQALAEDPNTLEAYLLKGHTALSQGDRRSAEAQLALARKVEPEHPQVLVLEGNIVLAFGVPKDALRPLLQAVEAAPEDAFALSSLGLAFLAAGNPAFAEQALRRALQRQPAARRLRWALVDALRQQRQFVEVLAELEILLASDPDDGAALALQGDLLLGSGDQDGALAAYRRLLAGEHAPGAPLSLVLTALLRAGASDVARALFEEVLSRRPTDDAVWLAGMALEADRPQAAQQYVSRWLAQCPDSFKALQERTVIAERLGELGAAEEFADLVLNLDPSSAPAHFIKLRAELRQNPAAALSRSERLLTAASNATAQRAALVWRGFAFDALGNWDAALQSWIEARKLPMAARPLPDPAPAAPPPQACDKDVSPRLLWGPPGSPVRQIADTLRGREDLMLLADRFAANPRPDGLGPDRPDGVMASQQDWRRVLQDHGVDPSCVLDWLPHFDARHAALLPDARLLAVLADPRDLLLNWLAYGSPQEYEFAPLGETGEWLATALQTIAERIESNRPGDLVVRLESLQSDVASCARGISRFCDLNESLDAAALQRGGKGMGDLPLSFAAGDWRNYSQVLQEGFAPLQDIARRLGYPAD